MNEKEAEKASESIVNPLVEFTNWLGESAEKAESGVEFAIWTSILVEWQKCSLEMVLQLSNAVDKQ